MPVKKKSVDLYPNRAFESIVMSAANALTFSQVQFGVGLFQGVAAIIHRIEWFIGTAATQELTTSADYMQLALTNRDDLTSILPVSQNVLAHKSIERLDFGTAAGGVIVEMPLVNDFSNLGGGGLIIPANPLYIGMDSLGLASAATVSALIYLTFKELADAEYVELIKTIMPANL
jgi:hypothetical protein